MPHYKDGTEALVGDVARGTGYNIKHEIIGTVLQVFPADTCNLRIAVTQLDPYGIPKASQDFRSVNGYLVDGPDGKDYRVQMYVEAGAIQEFELVHRAIKMPDPAALTAS